MSVSNDRKGKSKSYYVTVTVGYNEVVREMFLSNDAANAFMKEMKEAYPEGYILKESF